MKRLFALGLMSRLVFCSCVGMTAIVMPSTRDGTSNTTEVPDIPLAKAWAIAIADLGTNSPSFVCTGAWSIRKKFHGGWAMFFCSKNLTVRYLHVAGDGQVLQNSEASPKGGRLKVLPSLSMHEAVMLVTNTPGIAVVSVGWVEVKDEWQVCALSKNGEKLFTVDSKKRVRQEEPRKPVPVPE